MPELRPIKQPHEVRYANGKLINWKNPPEKNHSCMWTKKTSGGGKITGSFRTLCHMNRLNNASIKRFGKEIMVIQPDWNTSVPASAGTHDFDSVWDVWISGVDGWAQQRFFRANGLAGWYRHPPTFGLHYHGFTLPVPQGSYRGDDYTSQGTRVGIYVPGQLEDYYKEAFGLSGQHTPGSDNSWFPKDKEATVFNLSNYVKARAVRMSA